MNGRIVDSTGFSKTEGAVRRLTIREQLIQVRDMAGVNEIVHPVHGRIKVDRSVLNGLIATAESHLYRFKKSMFQP